MTQEQLDEVARRLAQATGNPRLVRENDPLRIESADDAPMWLLTYSQEGNRYIAYKVQVRIKGDDMSGSWYKYQARL